MHIVPVVDEWPGKILRIAASSNDCGSELNKPQVLVHVSTYQGPCWYRFFEPQINEQVSKLEVGMENAMCNKFR